ncbi:hypothetical protein, unlikely [Trypanosoma congolense IL3000]|uniref:Uncharacterized protein n=1 Tax=Trypanosoma congolense (strain IL3000) TaxID=1068625 RepID=F9W919_TRYCI|nr:hypothetical protein, unlikely [Trypanosoma congolense IL3000]
MIMRLHVRQQLIVRVCRFVLFLFVSAPGTALISVSAIALDATIVPCERVKCNCQEKNRHVNMEGEREAVPNWEMESEVEQVLIQECKTRGKMNLFYFFVEYYGWTDREFLPPNVWRIS